MTLKMLHKGEEEGQGIDVSHTVYILCYICVYVCITAGVHSVCSGL